MKVSFKTKEHPEAKSVEVDIPDTLEGLREKFGDEAIASNAKSAIVISLQGYLRGHIEKGDGELQELANSWKPGTRSPSVKKSALEKATAAIGGMSPEEKAELLKRLQAG